MYFGYYFQGQFYVKNLIPDDRKFHPILPAGLYNLNSSIFIKNQREETYINMMALYLIVKPKSYSI